MEDKDNTTELVAQLRTLKTLQLYQSDEYIQNIPIRAADKIEVLYEALVILCKQCADWKEEGKYGVGGCLNVQKAFDALGWEEDWPQINERGWDWNCK